MSSSFKKVLSHGSIYLLGSILQRCVSFIMLPIYTRYLTPEDYGTIELLSMILDFVGIVLGLRISEGIFRFYEKYNDIKDKNEVITTAMYLVALLNILGIIIIFLCARPLTHFVFGDYKNLYLLILFSFTLIGQGFIEIPMTSLKAQQKPWAYITFSILKLVLQLSLNIYFVVVKNYHVAGVIYSALFSSASMATLLGVYTFWRMGLRSSIKKAKQLFTFSIPLMLTSMLSFYITFGDRYFLKIYNGIYEVGIYALAYKFGFLLSSFIAQPFFSIWNSEKYKILKSGNQNDQYNRIFQGYNTIIFIFVLGVTLFVKDFLEIISEKSFWPAYRFVGVILAAYTINAWAGFVNIGILIKEKTIEITYGAMISTIVITFGYLFLIPKYGGFGAAWASLVAFSSAFIWVYIRSKRLYNMRLKWKNITIFIAIIFIANIFSSISPDFLILSLVYNFLLFVIFGIAIVAVNEEHRSLIFIVFKSKRKLVTIKNYIYKKV